MRASSAGRSRLGSTSGNRPISAAVSFASSNLAATRRRDEAGAPRYHPSCRRPHGHRPLIGRPGGPGWPGSCHGLTRLRLLGGAPFEQRLGEDVREGPCHRASTIPGSLAAVPPPTRSRHCLYRQSTPDRQSDWAVVGGRHGTQAVPWSRDRGGPAGAAGPRAPLAGHQARPPGLPQAAGGRAGRAGGAAGRAGGIGRVQPGRRHRRGRLRRGVRRHRQLHLRPRARPVAGRQRPGPDRQGGARPGPDRRRRVRALRGLRRPHRGRAAGRPAVRDPVPGRRPPAGPATLTVATRARTRRVLAIYGTAALVLALDQLTKHLVVANLAGRPPVDLVGSFVQLRYTTNSGGAFSLLTGAPLFFGIMAMVIVGGIVYASRRAQPLFMLVVLGLILGGALGNLTDRLFRGEGLLRGEVVDFVKVGIWPVFNVADSCVVVGGILLALLLGRSDRDTDQEAPADSSSPRSADPQ